jgi:hypothetical protein
LAASVRIASRLSPMISRIPMLSIPLLQNGGYIPALMSSQSNKSCKSRAGKAFAGISLIPRMGASPPRAAAYRCRTAYLFGGREMVGQPEVCSRFGGLRRCVHLVVELLGVGITRPADSSQSVFLGCSPNNPQLSICAPSLGFLIIANSDRHANTLMIPRDRARAKRRGRTGLCEDERRQAYCWFLRSCLCRGGSAPRPPEFCRFGPIACMEG